jgi:hypothetical protein
MNCRSPGSGCAAYGVADPDRAADVPTGEFHLVLHAGIFAEMLPLD